MNQKRFEYQHKDIPFLKKDIIYRLSYVALFGIVFFVQLFMIIAQNIKGAATVTSMIIGSVILVASLLFALLCLIFAFKDIKNVDTIKKSGYAVSAVSVLPSIQKNGFMKMYSIFTKLIAIVMLCLFAGVATYSILEYIHFSTLSPYLPLLLFMTVVSFNSVYHVQHEIKLTETVKIYHSAY